MTTKKAHYLIVASVISLVLILFAILYFGISVMKKESQKIIDAKLNIAKAQKTESIYSSNKDLYLKNQDLAQKINDFIPTEKEQDLIVAQLNSFANQSQLTISTISFPNSTLDPNSKQKVKTDISQATPVKGLNGVYEIPIVVTVADTSSETVNTDNLLKLLDLIESSPRNMRITSISYDAESNEIQLNITIFVKKA
ncbi:hypothetical protein KBC85_00240 [Candidatus Saccharibacteria bacterium]|nr:hypothetical protein [Candidatus Saccharibacteria bacterium]MDQ5958833.1 hypothetical protein [Patescibacteria group bacterium]